MEHLVGLPQYNAKLASTSGLIIQKENINANFSLEVRKTTISSSELKGTIVNRTCNSSNKELFQITMTALPMATLPVPT